MNGRLSILPVLLLATCVLPWMAAGCGTTKTTTKVTRAPWIAFGQAKTVRIEPIQLGCERVFVGPEMGKSNLASADAGIARLSVSRMVPVETRTACTTDALPGVQAAVEAQLQSRLAQQGYQVVPSGQADAPLRYSLGLTELVSIKEARELKDSKDDTRCKQTCNRPSCTLYDVEIQLVVDSKFHGPALVRGIEQAVDRDFSFGAIAGAEDPGHAQVIACSIDDARQLRQWNRVNWSMAARNLTKWLGLSFERMLASYQEDYDAVLFKVDDSPSNEAGLQMAKAAAWDLSAEHFRKALDSAAAPADADPEPIAKIRYNLAVALMSQGQLDEALEAVEESRLQWESDETNALLGEIKKRAYDRERMGASSSPSQGAGT